MSGDALDVSGRSKQPNRSPAPSAMPLARVALRALRRMTLPGSPLDDYAALLCKALERYSFPPVTFDFESERECCHDGLVRPHEAMRGVEKCVGELLRSPDARAVRDGLSNVLYWGFAQQPGLQRDRVHRFRDRIQPSDPRLDGFMKFVNSMTSQAAAELLIDLRRLGLPQFSQMSFTTKILMFLDPSRFAVLDLKIARVAKQCGFSSMQELRIYTAIPITRANADCYGRWTSWCEGIAGRVNGMPGAPCRNLSAVDVERAVFSLAALGLTDDARRLLADLPAR